MKVRAVDPARSRIVLVGTPTYDDPALPDVPVVASNISDLADVLTDPELGGFDAARCTVAPPRADIALIGDLLHDAADEAEDLLLFYYSGHGLLGSLRQELYLSLAGTKSNRLAFTALPFEAVRDACLSSRARSRVVILDSCFSGRAIGDTLASMNETILGQIQVSGTYTLTSAPANRTALILPGERHTAFTGRMLELFRTGGLDAGPQLSLGDIYRYLYTRLSAEGLPVPQQRGTETADLLGLVRNRSWIPKPDPRSEAPKGRSESHTGDRGYEADPDDSLFGLGDLFGGLFTPGDRQAGGTKAGVGRRGADVESEVTLKFGEAIDGATVSLRLTSGVQCLACSGIGAKAGATPRVCPACRGTGEVDSQVSTPGKQQMCMDCRGRGLLVDDPCPVCQGSGRAASSRTLQARIPAGVRDGQRIRLKGNGASGERGGPAGDLYVVVHVSAHAVFGREDDNLTVTVPVTFPEAVLGAAIQVPTWDSKAVRLKLPPRSQNGRVLRVRGYGLARKDGTKGDLLVRFEIAVPKQISSAAEEALNKYMRLANKHDPRLEQGRPEFVPVGADLGLTVPVTFPEAVFGATISIPTPDGEPFAVKIPPLSANGLTLRIPKEVGRRRLKKELLVAFEVKVPATVSDEAAEALRSYSRATAWHNPRARLLYDAGA